MSEPLADFIRRMKTSLGAPDRNMNVTLGARDFNRMRYLHVGGQNEFDVGVVYVTPILVAEMIASTERHLALTLARKLAA